MGNETFHSVFPVIQYEYVVLKVKSYLKIKNSHEASGCHIASDAESVEAARLSDLPGMRCKPASEKPEGEGGWALQFCVKFGWCVSLSVDI